MHKHTPEGSHLLCLYQAYPFGDEVSTHHQVILGNPSVAWENRKQPAPREEWTKTYSTALHIEKQHKRYARELADQRQGQILKVD